MRNKLNFFIAGMLISAVGILYSGGTLAYTAIHGATVNIVSTGSVAGKIVEQYETADNVMPGTTVDKVVNISNTGELDILVRVKVEKAWGVRGADNNLIKDDSLNDDYIIIDCDTDMWVYRDGYYYYRGVLKRGETTAKPLFSSFSVDKDAGNEYKNKAADIDIHLECVQAASGGVTAWGTTLEQLGIEYNSGITATAAEIGFNGTEFTFKNKDESGDLFYDFKNLVPGESRTQVIQLSNTSGSSSEILLKASNTAQDTENAALIDALLKAHLTVIITDDGGNVIYSGAIYGNLEGNSAETMKNYISLGNFENGQTKRLTVSLSVSPEMDNDYQTLAGRVKWELQADMLGNSVTTTAPTTTATTVTTTKKTTTAKATTTKATTSAAPTTTGRYIPQVTTAAGGSYATPSDAERPAGNSSSANGNNRPGSNSGNNANKETTKKNSALSETDLPTTGGKVTYAVFFTSSISFVCFLCAYASGRKKQRLGNGS